MKTLISLNIEGCKDLHRFPNAEGPFDEELCTNKTFPFLKNIRFEYHAHCCSYSNFKRLDMRPFLPALPSTQNCSATGRSSEQKDSSSHSRVTRSSNMYSCISLENGTIVDDYVPDKNEIYLLELLCEEMTYCFDNRCPDNCLDEGSSGSGAVNPTAEIACVSNDASSKLFSSQTASMELVTSTVMLSSASQFSSSSTSLVLMPTSTIETESLSNSITASEMTTTICWSGTSLIHPTSDIVPSSTVSLGANKHCCTTIEYVLLPTTTEDVVCISNTYSSSHSISSFFVSSPTNPPATDPPPTNPPPTECDEFEEEIEFEECLECVHESVCEQQGCEKYQSVCDALGRRKRSIDCLTYDCLLDGCDEFQHLCLVKRQRRDAANSITCSSCSATISNNIVTTDSESLSECSTTQINVMPSVTFTLVCSEAQSTSVTSLVPSPSPTNPPATDPPPTECDEFEEEIEFEECLECVHESVCEQQGCEKYQSVCDALGRRKRSIDCLMYDCLPDGCDEFQHLCLVKRQRRNVQPSTNCNSCTISMISAFTRITPSITHSSSSSSSTGATSTTATRSPMPTEVVLISSYCTPSPFLHPEWYYEVENVSSCYPGNDPFNPCFHILGDDILRVAIWIVFFVAITGNGTVIAVTILHWIFKYKKSKKEVNLLYILYLNLAFADLFMGLYLSTIAIIDIDTSGHYSLEAIDWQTGSGCAFAGFCAIFSSILSIYTLLVITIERVYSIKFALQKRHFKKHWVFIIMSIGWLLAIILAILPNFGLSSYDRVSICLPFENRGTEDKVYIVFVLSITGLASFFILFSYTYLFYIVGCSANKKLLAKSLSGKEEMKIAFRMSLLIFTDFATWAPIALFGLTAAFGHPLINDIKVAQVLMVFIFPLNSCLNPILYSFSTRLFRNNMLNVVRKCGLCTVCNKYKSSSFANKNTSLDASSDVKGIGYHHYHGQRRGTQLSMISRLASISSLGSRRDSTVSGSSIEEGSESRNNSFSTNNFSMEREKFPAAHHPLSRTHRDSDASLNSMNLTRLKALQEDNDETRTIKIELRRKDSTESDSSTSFHVISNIDATDASPQADPSPILTVSRRRQSVPTLPDIQEDSNIGLRNNTTTFVKENGLVLTNRRVIVNESKM